MISYDIWDISKHGDLVEKEYYFFINNQLPAYKQNWELFFGNNGLEQLAVIKNIPKELQIKRIELSEHHYTCLESLICMKEITAKHNSLVEINSIKDTIIVLNDITAFTAHAGKIRDNIIKICRLLWGQNEQYSSKLNEYYQQRNVVLHGKKIPFGIDDFYQIVKPLGEQSNNELWSDKDNWNDSQKKRKEFITDYFNEVFNEMTKITNGILYNFHDHIKKVLENSNLTMQPPPIKDLSDFQDYDTHISGSLG